jgi:hypothetical protein
MKSRSKEYETALAGSLIIAENGRFFNRLVFVENLSDCKILLRANRDEGKETKG